MNNNKKQRWWYKPWLISWFKVSSWFKSNCSADIYHGELTVISPSWSYWRYGCEGKRVKELFYWGHRKTVSFPVTCVSPACTTGSELLQGDNCSHCFKCHCSCWWQGPQCDKTEWLTRSEVSMAHISVVNEHHWKNRAKYTWNLVLLCSGLCERCWLRRMKLKAKKQYLTRMGAWLNEEQKSMKQKQTPLENKWSKNGPTPSPFQDPFLFATKSAKLSSNHISSCSELSIFMSS